MMIIFYVQSSDCHMVDGDLLKGMEEAVFCKKLWLWA